MRTGRLAIIASALAALAARADAQTVRELLRSGPNGSKSNLVVIGDGFTATQQNAYNNQVDTLLRDGVFHEAAGGVFRETANAFNLFRINANSTQSGITLVDSAGNVTTAVNTFFGYRFSGRWDRCWMEPGPTSNATITNTLNSLVPGWDFVFIILNTESFGGCRRGNQLAVTMGTTWTTAGHEMGHMIGNLGDEYVNDTLTYTGPEPGNANLTINTNRATLKWRAFVNPTTALPTNPIPAGWNNVFDAGLFMGGGGSFPQGIFRPSVNDRMNGNTPEYDSVCYDQLQLSVDGDHEYVFRNVYPGHFTRDTRDDFVLHNANSITLSLGFADTVAVSWARTFADPVWDEYRAGDKFFVGDFDGDGLDDLYVFNATDWAIPYFAMLRNTGNGFIGVRRFDLELPGWDDMKAHDEFFVADFDADGRDDIVVFNGRDWSVGYLIMLRSTGTNLQFVKRFDEELPGWDDMKQNDKFFVADFNNDSRDDLYVFNGEDWSVGYLEMLRSTGNDYVFTRRFDEELPGWDDMKRNDQFFVADFNNDGREDLYVFNGRDWSMAYLEMLRSTGTNMVNTRRFDGDVPGWGGMRANDRWFVADVNGDGRDDLYVFNSADWSTEYLGTFRSSGTNLSGGWQDDWIGSWNLGSVDNFAVANFSGGAGWQDLLVFNDNWFGLLRSQATRVSLTAIYPKWLHNHNFHNLGWW